MSQFTKELPTVPIMPVWCFFGSFFYFLWVYTSIKQFILKRTAMFSDLLELN